jgi:hypothetical protein
MNRRMDDYIAAARQFERLAQRETLPEAKRLMMEQAETCYRLANKRASPTQQPGTSVPQ